MMSSRFAILNVVACYYRCVQPVEFQINGVRLVGSHSVGIEVLTDVAMADRTIFDWFCTSQPQKDTKCLACSFCGCALASETFTNLLFAACEIKYVGSDPIL